MTINTKQTIGIIGTGRLGTAVARLAIKADYHVIIANSHGPQSLELITDVLMPGAKAATVVDLIKQSDIIVLAIPLNQYKILSENAFAHKVVIDAMNYWPETEGTIAEFIDQNTSSSEVVQSFLSEAKIVKTLNHVAYHELEQDSLPEDTKNRRAIALAGNDTQAKILVSQFITNLGFDPVDLGNLNQGKKFQPTTILFNQHYTVMEMKRLAS